MKAPIDLDAGVFCQLEAGHILPLRDIKYGTEIVKARSLISDGTCLFDISVLEIDGERAGIFFETQFTTVNQGGYLLAYLKNKPKAEECETLIRTENLIVYHYRNRGTLAISTRVNNVIDSIFMDQ